MNKNLIINLKKTAICKIYVIMTCLMMIENTYKNKTVFLNMRLIPFNINSHKF